MSTSTFARWSCLLVLSACLMPATALGTIIDQWHYAGTAESTFTNYYLMGQTFTPSAPVALNPLAEIWLDVWGSGSARVDIYATSGGLPTGSSLANSNYVALPGSSGPGQVFELLSYPSVTPGTQYALVARGLTAAGLNYQYDASDGYGGGTRLTGEEGWPFQIASGDLHFETRHTPEPTAMVGLLSMGSLAFVYSRLRRRSAERAAR